MLYLAESLLLEENMAFSKHSGVIAAFGQVFAKTGRAPAELHRYLIEGVDSRNVGDYDTGPGLGPDDAESQIARAEKFLAATERLLKPSTDTGG
jgi:uncharacterized protein (UPF0332 family)